MNANLPQGLGSRVKTGSALPSPFGWELFCRTHPTQLELAAQLGELPQEPGSRASTQYWVAVTVTVIIHYYLNDFDS